MIFVKKLPIKKDIPIKSILPIKKDKERRKQKNKYNHIQTKKMTIELENWIKTLPSTATNTEGLKLEEEYEHENDRFIYFDEGPHKYYIWDQKNNRPVNDPISITTLIKKFHEEFDDEKVINMNMSKWQLQPENKYYGKTKQQIKDGWEENRVLASTKGTRLHKRIELFYNDVDYKTWLVEEKKRHEEDSKNPVKKQMYQDDEEDRVGYRYFENFHREIPLAKKWFSYRTEWRIYCARIGVCGTIDKIYIPDMSRPSEIIIYDWKRSKKIDKTNKFQRMKRPIQDLEDCNYIHYSLQLNAYKYLLEKNYGFKVVGMFLCICHPDNSDYKTYEISPNYGAHIEKILNFLAVDKSNTFGTTIKNTFEKSDQNATFEKSVQNDAKEKQPPQATEQKQPATEQKQPATEQKQPPQATEEKQRPQASGKRVFDE